jgi:hypothetical protein
MGLVTVPPSVAGATSPTTTIYDSTDPASVQLPSLAFQATQATEIGNQVVFAPGTSRTLNNVVVSMDSWGCATGSGTSCVTPSGATFAQPITLNLYAANLDNTPGALITTVTQTVNLAYRPSADNVNCTGGAWFNAGDSTCYHGIVTNATLNLGDVTVPDKVIYGVEIRTSSYGDPAIGGPLGTSTACFTSTSGCPYDSLNVAVSLDPTNVTVGSNALTNGLYWATTYGPFYCDNGAGGTGTFRFDSGCWGDSPPYTSAPYDVPAVQFNATSTCTTVCYVSPSGNDTNAGVADSPFATISHAVSTVSSGGQVLVGPGTYNENVHITQPLTLAGANATQPGTGARGPESVISTNNAGNDYTVQISSPGVTVDGFTIQQTAPVTCSSCAAFGVQIDPTASGATVADNIITGMTTSGSNPGTQAGNPIGVDVSANNTATPNSVTVARNLIENITSTGTQHKSAQGIQVGDSSSTLTGSGLVIGLNRITNVQSAAWGSYGLIFNRPSSGAQVVGNTIDTLNGRWAHAIGLEGNTTSPVITNNAISGISATTADSADIVTDATNNVGVTTATVSHNSLGGVTSGGIGSVSTGALTAANNWWGCASGPNTAGCSVTGGTGPLNLTPWIVSYSPDPAHAGQPGFWPIAITSSAAPVITSANTTVFHVGVAGTFTVTASGTPAPTLSETGALPAGVTFNAATGVLSGTPTGTSSTNVTFSAHNGAFADGTQSFTLVVSSNTATITSAASVQIAAGKKVNFTVTTGGHPAATVTVSGLPAWMTFKALTGNKSGTAKLAGVGPAGGGNFTLTVHANNGQFADTTQAFTVHVLAISSSASANFSKSGGAGQSFTITTTGAGSGVTLAATLGGDQAGLTFHDNGNGTATISGQPLATARTHTVMVTATSGAAHVTQKLAVGIST